MGAEFAPQGPASQLAIWSVTFYWNLSFCTYPNIVNSFQEQLQQLSQAGVTKPYNSKFSKSLSHITHISHLQPQTHPQLISSHIISYHISHIYLPYPYLTFQILYQPFTNSARFPPSMSRLSRTKPFDADAEFDHDGTVIAVTNFVQLTTVRNYCTF